MAFVLADRVQETSATTGTGTFSLAGAVVGYQGFVAGIGSGNSTFYVIQNLVHSEWEVGIGTVTDAATDTLSRDAVLASSNAGAKVDFSAGTKQVFIPDPPALRAVYRSAAAWVNSRAVITDAVGALATSVVTTTELGYLSGATSNIQNQIDNISLDAISNFAQDRIAGRVSAGSGDSEELTPAQVMALLSSEATAAFDFNGQNVSAGDFYVPDGGFVGVSGADGWTFDSSNGDIGTTSNVGIGTTEPSERLHVSDGVAVYDPDRSITDLHHLVDKKYVDEAVTALGARYYMLDTDSGEEDYKDCSITPSAGGEQSVSKAGLSDDDYVQGWIAPNVNEPDKLIIGVYNWRVYAEKTAGTKTLRLYWRLVERKNDDSEVVIGTSVVSNEIVSGKNSYIIPLTLSADYDIASDSYVVGKMYANVSGSGNDPSVTLYYEGDSDSHWEIPVNLEILDDIYIRQGSDATLGDIVTLHNTTHEDADDGRKSEIRFKGEQSGGEISTLAKVVVAHDGAADDEKGKITLLVNDGNDGDSPSKEWEFNSAGKFIASGIIQGNQLSVQGSSIFVIQQESKWISFYHPAFNNTKGFIFRSYTPDRSRITMGPGAYSQLGLTANLDQNDVLIERDVDGGGSYSEAGSLLKLYRDVTNVTSEAGHFLECEDEANGVELCVDRLGNLILGGTSVGANGDTIITLNNGTAPGALANTASFVALAGEMWGYDSGGAGSLLTCHATDAPSYLYVGPGPGLEWMDKRMVPYGEGRVVFTNAKGEFSVETYAQYNKRRRAENPNHVDLRTVDWDEEQESIRLKTIEAQQNWDKVQEAQERLHKEVQEHWDIEDRKKREEHRRKWLKWVQFHERRRDERKREQEEARRRNEEGEKRATQRRLEWLKEVDKWRESVQRWKRLPWCLRGDLPLFTERKPAEYTPVEIPQDYVMPDTTLPDYENDEERPPDYVRPNTRPPDYVKQEKPVWLRNMK